jgi:Na+/H+-dicarboxylate symporter
MFSYLINKIKTDPAAQILFSVFLAAVIFMPIGSSPDLKSLPFIQWLSVDVLDTVGTMLMNALKLMILPLVFLGIMTGISGMRDLNK